MLLNVTIPVYNEERRLPAALETLYRLVSEEPGLSFEIVVADNASTDGTVRRGRELAGRYPNVRVLSLPTRGRGGALRAAWSASSAEILSYTDVDLSADIHALPGFASALGSGEYDIAVGSRLLDCSKTIRSRRRELLSRGYNHLITALFRVGFSDAQCGLKALTQRAARTLLPRIENNEWFFDTELLILAEDLGLRIFDSPVDWVEDRDSRVRIVPTVLEDLRGLARLYSRRLAGRLGK